MDPLAQLSQIDTQFNQQNLNTPQSLGQSPVRRPGNFLTHLLPAVGGTLGSIIGTVGGIGGTIAGGSGGSALGKVLENKLEKQSLTSGVGGQAALGGAAGLGGELLGAGFNALKGGAEAGTEAAGEAAAQTGKMTATEAGSQNIGEKLMSGVNGISADRLPGNTVGNVGEAARLNKFANEELALRGNSTQRLGDLAKQFDETNAQLADKFTTGGKGTTSLDTINQAIDSAVKEHPLNPTQPDLSNLSSGDIAKLNAGGAFDNPVNQNFAKAASDLKGIAAKMGESNGNNFSDAELNNLRQEIDKFAKFNTSGANATDIPSEAAKASRSALNDILAEKNPGARSLISKQSDMIKVGDALGKQSGYARAGIRLGGVRIPVNVQSGIESAQSALGVLAGGGTNAERLIPAAAQEGAQLIGNKLAQGQQSSTQNAGDLAKPSDALTKQLQGFVPEGTPMVGGLPSSDRIRQAELQDLQKTGGKNYSFLSKLGTLAAAQEKQSVLPTTAQKGIQTYQQHLGTLQNIAQTFQGNGDFNSVANLMAQSTPELATATGLSAKQVVAALPNASDSPDAAFQKLQALKTLIDAKAEDGLSNNLANVQDNNQSSFLGQLTAAGATP